MKIEIISFSAQGKDDVALSIELRDGENCERRRLVLPSFLCADMQLCRGECTPELFDRLLHEEQVYSAYKRGVYIVGFGISSQRMLASKLISKGFERAIAEEAVARIAAKGFLCEGDNAMHEAQRCAAKLWGQARIRAHLGSRGYSSDAIDAAMFSLEDSGVDFDVNCRRLIESKCKNLPSDRIERQKLVASVARYGYSIGQIKTAMAKIAAKKQSIYD